MTGIVTSRTRTLYQRPPSGVACVNWASGQARGLEAWFLPGGGGRFVREVLADRQSTLSHANVELQGAAEIGGGCLNFPVGGGPDYYAEHTSAVLTAGPVTLTAWYNTSNNSGSGCALFSLCLQQSGQQINGWVLGLNSDTSPKVTASAYLSSNAGIATSPTGGTAAGLWHHGAAVFESATSRYAYADGAKGAQETTSIAVSSTLNRTVIRGYYNSNSISAGSNVCAVADCRVYSRALTDAEVWHQYDPGTRWDLYYPLGRRIWSFPTAGGGGSPVTVTPTTAALTLTAFAPTVSTPRLATPPTVGLTLTTFAPAVSTSDVVVVTPTTAGLTLTTFAPTVSTPVAVTPSTASLTLTSFAPTVSAPRVCTPATAALTLTTFAPDVTATTGDDVVVTPTTAALTLTAFAPTVGTPRTCTPATAALTLTAFAPTVQTPRTCTPTPLSLSLTSFAASVSTPRTVTPGTASLITAGFAPTVRTPRLATPDPATLTTAFFAPTVTTTANVTVTPGPLALVLTSYAPTAQGDVLLPPITEVTLDFLHQRDAALVFAHQRDADLDYPHQRDASLDF